MWVRETAHADSLPDRAPSLQSSWRYFQTSTPRAIYCTGKPGLEPGRLVRDDRIPRGVRLVEPITSELENEVKEVFCLFGIQPFLAGPINEVTAGPS